MPNENFRVFDNRKALSLGRLHLTIPLGGKLIRYAYIRKNGCSSFKHAMGYEPETRIAQLRAEHRCGLLGKFDATIFVWRDPEERLVSLYRNKVLDGISNTDIMQPLERFARGRAIDFELFTEFAVRCRDPHCTPQAWHLKPLLYTHAIPLHRLHAAMTELVGTEAARPFRKPVNASSPTPITVTERTRRLIRGLYAADYALITRLTPLEPAHAALQRL